MMMMRREQSWSLQRIKEKGGREVDILHNFILTLMLQSILEEIQNNLFGPAWTFDIRGVPATLPDAFAPAQMPPVLRCNEQHVWILPRRFEWNACGANDWVVQS